MKAIEMHFTVIKQNYLPYVLMDVGHFERLLKLHGLNYTNKQRESLKYSQEIWGKIITP